MAICSDRLSKKKEETLVDLPSNLEVRDYSCVQPSWATPPCRAECSSVPSWDGLFQASRGLAGLPSGDSQNDLRWWDALWRGIWHSLTAKENFRVERNDQKCLWFYPTADKFTNFFFFSLLFHCPMSGGPDERGRRNPLFVTLGKTPREPIFRHVMITGCNWDNADEPLRSEEARKEWVTEERAGENAVPRIPSRYLPVKDPLRLHQAVDHVGQVILGGDHFRGRVVFIHCCHLFRN